jgi:ADP-ribose pyrophosphatase
MTEKTLHIEKPFIGRVFQVEVQTVETDDGRQARREVVRHNGGACVLALDENQRVYLVRQFRKPYDMELLEVPAGKLETGEEPIDCARRELREETGLMAENLVWLATMYPSPGYCSEVLTIYLATGLTRGEASLDEGEHLVCERHDLKDVLAMVDQGVIRDGKTQVALLTLSRMLSGKSAETGGRTD